MGQAIGQIFRGPVDDSTAVEGDANGTLSGTVLGGPGRGIQAVRGALRGLGQGMQAMGQQQPRQGGGYMPQFTSPDPQAPLYSAYRRPGQDDPFYGG